MDNFELYSDFAEEDKLMAEEGMDDYLESLKVEDTIEECNNDL